MLSCLIISFDWDLSEKGSTHLSYWIYLWIEMDYYFRANLSTFFFFVKNQVCSFRCCYYKGVNGFALLRSSRKKNTERNKRTTISGFVVVMYVQKADWLYWRPVVRTKPQITIFSTLKRSALVCRLEKIAAQRLCNVLYLSGWMSIKKLKLSFKWVVPQNVSILAKCSGLCVYEICMRGNLCLAVWKIQMCGI